jgi:hypothetical protein
MFYLYLFGTPDYLALSQKEVAFAPCFSVQRRADGDKVVVINVVFPIRGNVVYQVHV